MDIEKVVLYGIGSLLFFYLVWYDLVIPIACWIESKIPYGYEDDEGFHYGDGTTITDDYSSVSAWCPECHQKTMYVNRPGDFRCSNCN